MNSITGLPNPTLPLTGTSASAIALDGLFQSNVRKFAFFDSFPDRRDLASDWLPNKLRVQVSIVDAGLTPDMILFPGWWKIFCKVDPTCFFGHSTPWYAVPPPSIPVPLLAATAGSVVGAEDSATPAALALLRTVHTHPGRVLVPASEHTHTLARYASDLAPRVAFVDLEPLSFAGALANSTSGQLVPVRRRLDDAGTVGMVQSTEAGPIPCATEPGAGTVTRVATLSAVRQELYVLERRASEAVSHFRVFSLQTEQWEEIVLTGAAQLAWPTSVTYDAQADALFALDRTASATTGNVRLLRIRRDGRVDALKQGLGSAHKAAVFLTAAEDGSILLAASREQSPHFRILHFDVLTKTPKPIGRLQGKGRLAGPPFLTARAIHVAAERLGALKVYELPPAELGPPNGTGIDWIFN